MRIIHLTLCLALASALTLAAAALPLAAAARPAGEADHLEPALAGRDDIVFYGGFETLMPGDDKWRDLWGAVWGPGRPVTAVTGDDAFIGQRSLRVDYPKGGVGPLQTGTQWPATLRNLPDTPDTYEALHLRYYVRFEPGFDFRLGGKLPGLMGGGSSQSRSGGNQPDGTNGWTLRFMWGREGRAVVYAYLPPGKYHQGTWGQSLALNRNFTEGKWHCIEQFVQVNTVGEEDGVLKVWFDGELALDLTDVTYRTVDNENGRVGGFYFSTFHGGNTADWGPHVDSYAQFDGFVLATERVGLFDPDGGQRQE